MNLSLPEHTYSNAPLIWPSMDPSYDSRRADIEDEYWEEQEYLSKLENEENNS